MNVRTSEFAGTDTRQRLLEAAGVVFADHGYRAARVRDICERADANIAAVNYYFGHKAKLYSSVLRYAHGYLMRKYPLDADLPADAQPEQRLHAFVSAHLRRVFDHGQPSWHGRLVAREVLEPTEALDELVRESIRPQAEAIRSIVRDLGEGILNEEDVRLCAESIMGQCLLYRHAKSVLLRLSPEGRFSGDDIDHLSRHITSFSLAGIRNRVDHCRQMSRSR